MFLHNASLSETDAVRAKENNVVLFDDIDLQYYEDLAHTLDPPHGSNFSRMCCPAGSFRA